MIRHSGFLRPLSRSALTRMARVVVLFTLVLALAGCGRWFNREDPLETLPVEQMYSEAKGSLMGGNLGRAARYYQRLIARFPYGEYTEQAQIELAFTHYRNRKHEEALSTINRFIKTYPAHQQTAYAFYLKALINFDRDSGLLDRVAGIDSTMRDQSSAKQSFDDFAELIRRYPDTRYAVDARQRMVYLRNRMARYEINVATYYLRRKAWVAAAKRAQHIIELYPQAKYQADALAVLAESYTRLGQEELAADALRVLRSNDPDHPYFSGGWPSQPSWWKKLVPFSGEERG